MDKKLKLAYLSFILFLCAGWNTCWFGQSEPGMDATGAIALRPAEQTPEPPAVAVTKHPGPTLTQPVSPAAVSEELFVSPALADRVKLWETVYADYDRSRFVIYHMDHPGIIYAVISDLPGVKEREIARIRARLYALDQITLRSKDPIGEINKRADALALLALYQKFEGVNEPRRFGAAARLGQIGVLRGRRLEFIQAYGRAGPYLSEMEKIFKSQGLPPELTRLVFVESMFDREAESSAGALGTWQVLPESAKPYLVMTHAIDERRDPLASTRAAAKILKFNFHRLGTWPLAVTAYNAGANRMIRAVRITGSSSLAEIFLNYDHKAFGFAVENFYAQLIAIIRAEEKLGLSPENFKPALDPFNYDLVRLPAPYFLSRLSTRLGMGEEMLITLNPAWTAAVERNQLPIPGSYLLRVPKGSEVLVRAALNLPPQDNALKPEPKSARAEIGDYR